LFDHLTAMTTAVALVMLVPIGVAAQGRYPRDAPKQPGAPSWERERATLPPYSPPRTPEGTPDLQGRWTGPNGGDDIEEHDYATSARRLRRRISPIRRETRCYLPGVPRITYMPHPFRIVQQADRVTILYEYVHAVRYVFMNGKPHPPGPIDWWMGDSRGRWDGSSLVVDMIHLSDRTWLDRAGNFHSEALHVAERYTPAGPDHMRYEVTLEDPKVFTPLDDDAVPAAGTEQRPARVGIRLLSRAPRAGMGQAGFSIFPKAVISSSLDHRRGVAL
jgi:hypothetical protein